MRPTVSAGTEVNCGFCDGKGKVWVGTKQKTCTRCSGTGKVKVNEVRG